MRAYVAFSTSSPLVSVAIFDESGRCLEYKETIAPRTASNAALSMLKNLMKALQLSNEQIAGYMADTGPGSFTGVKVGVTLAKTLAFASNSLVAGATSFDLIDKEQPVAIQIRRGYHLVRYPNGPVVSVTKPSQEIRPGYGEFHSSPSYPHAKNFESLFNQLSWVRPEVFVPSYMAEPNISQPKKPYKSKVEP